MGNVEGTNIEIAIRQNTQVLANMVSALQQLNRTLESIRRAVDIISMKR